MMTSATAAAGLLHVLRHGHDAGEPTPTPCAALLRQDRSLRLWDLRACGGSGPPGPPAATQPGLLHSFGGYGHAVTAAAAHAGTALSCSRGKVALTSLAPPHAAEVMQPIPDTRP